MNPDYFFLTYKGSNLTYLCVKKQAAENSSVSVAPQYEKHLFIPEKYETMQGKQINRYKKSFNKKFLWWSLNNKASFRDLQDHRAAVMKIYDIQSDIMMTSLCGFFLNRLLRRIESPFLDLLFEDKFIKFSTFKTLTCLSLTCMAIYFNFRHQIGANYIYDIGLKYKEKFVPGELKHEDIDKLLASLDKL